MKEIQPLQLKVKWKLKKEKKGENYFLAINLIIVIILKIKYATNRFISRRFVNSVNIGNQVADSK